jgi:hypothetical protein
MDHRPPRTPFTLPFSAMGKQRLDEAVTEFAIALLAESSNLSRRDRADVVSARDVERARNRLFRLASEVARQGHARGRRGSAYASTSNALALAAIQHPSPVDVFCTAVAAALGLLMRVVTVWAKVAFGAANSVKSVSIPLALGGCAPGCDGRTEAHATSPHYGQMWRMRRALTTARCGASRSSSRPRRTRLSSRISGSTLPTSRLSASPVTAP